MPAQPIDATENLHACRNIARRMFPENYEGRMDAYSTTIKSVQKHRGCDVVEAATALAEVSAGRVASICYMAAAAEMLDQQTNI